MADYPSGVYSPRTKSNRYGVVYDATKSTVGYAEDITKLDAEVVAIETELGANPKGNEASVAARFANIRDNLRREAQGLISENIPAGGCGSASILIHQTIYYTLVGLLKGDVINKINVVTTVAGTSSINCFVGIYDSAGNKVATSNDLTTALDATAGLIQLSLNAPYTVPSSGAYYLALLVRNTTTLPTLLRGTSSANAMVGVGSGKRGWSNQTGQSTLPTTATFGAATFAVWMGAS